MLQKDTDGTSKSLPTKPIENKSDAIKNEEIESESEIKDLNSEKGSETKEDFDGGKNDEKKSKRKRKRKNHEDSSRNNSGGDLLSVLQIMPRTEWKRLRNKYLNLQRKNMAHSKMRLKQFYDQQKNKRFSNQEEFEVEKADQDEEDDESKPKIEFTVGIIVKFVVNDPIEDEKKVKQRIKAALMEPVNYVDVKVGATVRISDNNQKCKKTPFLYSIIINV